MIFQDISYGYTIGTFLPGIIIIGIRIIIAVMIARDAQRRGMEPTIFVILNCCCGCCIGGIVYLITASNNPPQDDFQQPTFSSSQNVQYGQPQTTYGQPQYQHTTQPPQHKPVPPKVSTTMPDIDMTICSVCGSQNKKNSKYCSHCGADLN